MNISDNFSYKEFEHSDTAIKLGIENKIKDDLIRENIISLVKNILQPLRDHLGKAVKINSGYRCLKLNKAVGGKPTSQHVMGQAADIVVDGISPYEVAKTIIDLELPFDQLGLYDNFIHVSYSYKNRRTIFYDKKYNDKRIM